MKALDPFAGVGGRSPGVHWAGFITAAETHVLSPSIQGA